MQRINFFNNIGYSGASLYNYIIKSKKYKFFWYLDKNYYSQVVNEENIINKENIKKIYSLTNLSYNTIYHLNYPVNPRYYPIYFLNNIKNNKIISHFHGTDVYNFRSSLRKLSLRKSDLVLYSTKDLYNPLMRQLSLVGRNCPVIWYPNPIDLNAFAKLSKNKNRLDEILIYAPTRPDKNILALIKKNKNNGENYVILDFNNEYSNYLKSYILNEKIKNFRFVPKLKHKDVPNMLSKYKRVIPQNLVTTRTMIGIYGMADMEAVACGCKIEGMEFLTKNYLRKNHDIKVTGPLIERIYDCLQNNDIEKLHSLEKEPIFEQKEFR